MMSRLPEPPAELADQPPSVACDVLALLNRKLDLIALIDQCRRHARDAHDSAALTVLDWLCQGELDDVAMLMKLPGGGAEAQAVRQWLVEAWRHGEVVMDANGNQPNQAEQPVDRFAIAPPRAAPAADPATRPAESPQELDR
jgi:hypothetical protein